MCRFGKLLGIVLATLAVSGNAYVGKWHSFTNRDRVTSLIAHQGFVYAGTQGGIRRINPATLEEKDFGNLDGLLDCAIVGLSETSDGVLWAVSRSGYLYALSGDSWIPAGQSYAAEQWSMNTRAVFASGQYLFLGSEKGLTVFDATHQVAKANLTRFGSQLDLSILSMLVKGDTLYVGTSLGVYKAGVNFSNLFPSKTDTAFGNLTDPSIWKQASSTPGSSPPQYDYLTFLGNTLTAYGPGMILQSPVSVRVFSGQPAVIGSKSFPGNTNLTSALSIGGKIFLGGDTGIAVSSNPTNASPSLASLTNPSLFPRDTVFAIGARGNELWGQSMFGVYHINSTTGNTTSFVTLFADGANNPIPTPEINVQHLRNVKLGDNGDAYVGSWGLGLLRIRNGQKRIWDGETSSCIIEVIPSAKYTVVSAVSDISKSHLFFSVLKGNGETNELVHLDTATGQITCMDTAVSGSLPHDVRFFSDTLIGVASDRGLALYKLREGFSAPVLTSMGLWKTSGSANEAWGIAPDHWGRPWALIGDNLAYADSVDTLSKYGRTTLKSITGFSGTGCFSLQNDPAGSLWVGCSNGLFHVTLNPTSVEKIEHYALADGLVGLSVSDISVDPVNGHVWVATDHGISMLESSAQPAVTTLQTVQVYPNPFRPQHRFAIFDNLPRDATLRIHTAAGSVVRIFHPKDLTGNQAQWDGNNESGKAVAAGVYLFSVTSGSSVERGKIIVAR